MATEPKKDSSQLWMVICALLCLGWWSSTSDRFKTSPRDKPGIDTVKYGDTVYVIKFQVDTAIYADPNPDGEPVPDPRY